MAQFFTIHPVTPQARLIHQAVRILRDGAVIAYPTDTTYALGASIGDKGALDRICRIRQIAGRHHFTIVCPDLSVSGTYARFSTPTYRLLKACTPGPYTFILRAAPEVPRRLMHPKKKTIGLRVPDHRIAHALLEELGEPMLTTTLRLPGEEDALNDPLEIRDRLQHDLDLVIDGGPCSLEPTTVVDLVDDQPRLIRVGKGDPTPFE